MNFFNSNPFNIKRDLKNNGIKLEEEKEQIVKGIAAQILLGYGRKQCIELFSCKVKQNKSLKIVMAKIKTELDYKGNNKTLRSICLIDEVKNYCIILHIYSKNNKEDLSQSEKNMTKKMFKQYCEVFYGGEIK